MDKVLGPNIYVQFMGICIFYAAYVLCWYIMLAYSSPLP